MLLGASGLNLQATWSEYQSVWLWCMCISICILLSNISITCTGGGQMARLPVQLPSEQSWSSCSNNDSSMLEKRLRLATFAGSGKREWERCIYSTCRVSNGYSDNRYDQMRLRLMYKLPEVGRAFDRYYRPFTLSIPILVFFCCCFWSYSLPS